MATIFLYGNMNWFEPAEQPDSFECLPEEIALANELWQKDGEKNFDQIVKILEKYVSALCVTSNLMDYESVLSLSEDDQFFGVPAVRSRIVGVDFDRSSPLPTLRAEAVFELSLADGISTKEFDEWSECQALCDALVFRWDFEDSEDVEDLDLSFGDNLGCECIRVDKSPW